MRRVGLAFWLLRVALPAIVMHWSGRVIRVLRFRVDGLAYQQRSEDPVTALMKALGWSNAAAMLLMLLLILEIVRIIAR
jgi:hypothetical protein